MKEIFKGAVTRASCGVGPLRGSYVGLVEKGMKTEMARLTLAREIAANHPSRVVSVSYEQTHGCRAGGRGFESGRYRHSLRSFALVVHSGKCTCGRPVPTTIDGGSLVMCERLHPSILDLMINSRTATLGRSTHSHST